MMTEHNLDELFAPLLAGELSQWQGLPALAVDTVLDAWGAPAEQEAAAVGAYGAERLRYPRGGARTLLLYVRHGQVIMVEVTPPCDLKATAVLGEPTAVLPQEIAVADAYAHEFLYADRGLLLTVAEDLRRRGRKRVVRCRGIRPLTNAKELGAELYWPQDLDTQW